jgi:hypothetical protein
MGVVARTNKKAVWVVPPWRDNLANYWPLLLLAAVGLIWSLSFWQHDVFPDADYFAFVNTGRQWLSFEIPNGMKRAPVFSVIAGLGSMMFSHPRVQLASTEMYNALLLPTSMILFYLVGRGLLGCPAAVVTALLAGISPWVIQMSSEPLAEMTLVVFFAAAVLCVARGRVGWAYVLAMLASIARWDMAGLIPAVALADLAQNRRFGRMLWKAALASIPFLLCMTIMRIQLAGQEKGTNYLHVLSEERGFALWQDLESYWVTMLAWIGAPPSWRTAGRFHVLHHIVPIVFWLTAIPLGLAFLCGSVQGLMKRRWEILVILVTGVPYVLIHAVYPYRYERYCVPMAWAGLTLSAYGAKSVLAFLQGRWAAWDRVKSPLLVSGTLLFAVWAVGVALTLRSGIGLKVCPGIGATVCWSGVAAIVGYLGYEWVRAAKPGLHWTTVPAFLALAILSSGTLTAKLMGDGKMFVSFRTLSLWFKDNAQPGDKMVTTMPHYMRIYTGLPIGPFVETGSIPIETAPDFPGFVKACRTMGVTLIAWDSRLAGNTQDRYYKLWGLDRIEPLGQPFTGQQAGRIGSCELVQIISQDWPQIAVWRIMPED